MNQPKAIKVPKSITQHGKERVDNYAWLRDDNWKKFIKGDLDFNNSEVKSYLDLEAEFTKTKMSDTEALQKNIYDDLLSRLKEDDESYPIKRNNYYYYRRTEEGLSYPILCRKKDNLEGSEEIYFDINKVASDHKLYLHRGATPNDDNTLLAYMYNLTGSMDNTIRVRDLTTNKDYEWKIEDCGGSFFWLDNKTLLFVENDESSRGKKIWSFDVSKGPTSKVLLFEKPKEHDNRFLWITRSKDKELYTIYLSSGSSVVIYLKKSDEPEFKHFKTTQNNIEYSFEHTNDNIFLLTNDFENNNFAIYCSTYKDLSNSEKWKKIISNQKNICMNDIVLYGDKLVITEKNNEMALPQITVLDINEKAKKVVTMKDDVYSAGVIGAFDSQANDILISYESPNKPPQVKNLNLTTCETVLLKTKEIPNFNPEDYAVKRDFAKGHDGQEIPLTVLYKKSTGLTHPENKAFVYAYGSYGHSMPSFFSPNIFSLIDRGFIFVVAHIRGGSDKGNDWYLDGKMRSKMNTFKDFISSCEHLVESKVVKPGNIAINGGSAGGLLMGAVANMRPDLFNCVIADVAFVDVINTISDETLPLTPPEWEEWGNPITNKGDYEYMMQYSPYDNIEKKDYPATLYNSGISDEQVTYWEPAKMVAKLRELKTDDNLLLLNIKMHAGHAGASDRYEGYKDRAFNYAFVLKAFGITT